MNKIIVSKWIEAEAIDSLETLKNKSTVNVENILVEWLKADIITKKQFAYGVYHNTTMV